MTYFEEIPLSMPVIVTFTGGKEIKGEITHESAKSKYFYFHSNDRKGSGPKYKSFKDTWTFTRVKKNEYRDQVKSIRILNNEHYEIF